jgi:hypothetical protein
VRGGFTEADARDLRERLDQFIPYFPDVTVYG